jgi:hypothetical protein
MKGIQQMFTIRFVQHDDKERYKSYSCRAYDVHHDGTGEAIVRMHFTDGELYEEQVGPETPYEVAYVTNVDSRTIDVVRAMNMNGFK